jgi:cyclase
MRRFRIVLLKAVTFLIVASCAVAQKSDVQTFKVQGNVWMIVGAGGNIAVQTGPDGILLVDSGSPGSTQEMLAALREISNGPVRYIINTGLSADHVGGNAVLAPLPDGMIGGKGRGPTPALIGHENLLLRMSTPGPQGKAPYAVDAWPTDGYQSSHRSFFFNGEVVEVLHQPSAHTDGDSIVYFRGSNVIVSGDIFTTTNLPLIDRKLGGTSKGLLNALNAMLDITVPENMTEGGTYIIPGHGRVCDQADLAEYRDMLHEIRDRMEDLVKKQGLSLADAKAKHPVVGWEGRYDRPEWTVDMFVETLYQELKETAAK